MTIPRATLAPRNDNPKATNWPKNEDLFSGKGKEVTGKRDMKPRARISCSPSSGESWHQAIAIDDRDPVAVASQGSSLSHSA